MKFLLAAALLLSAKAHSAVLSLGDLSAFAYNVPEGKAQKSGPKPKIPAWIQKLDGTHVTIQGFMVPFDVEEDGVKSFNLVKNIMMCCFGLAPQLNEMVLCDMTPGQKSEFFVNIPIDVSGILHVGEIRDHSYLIGLYRMDVEKTERSKNPDPALMRTTGPRPSPFSKGPPKWMPQGWGPPPPGR
jgi:hypothetical protein